jgi:FkbM family methyltransferase
LRILTRDKLLPLFCGGKAGIATVLPPRLKRLVAWLLNYDDERTRWKRRRAYPRARASTPHLLVETDHATYCIPSAYAGTGRRLFIDRRSSDQLTLERAVGLLHSLGKAPLPGAVFLDVGANIGTAAIFAVRRCGFGTALAFEPEPRNYRILRVNVLLNDLEDAIAAHPVAISDRDGRLSMRVSPRGYGRHMIVDAPPGAEHAGKPVIAVEALTLQSALARHGCAADAVGLLWIDVEGHEPRVLAGAGPLLEAGVPVVAEYSPERLREAGELDRFEQIAGTRFTWIFDLGRPGRLDSNGLPARLPAPRISELRDAYRAVKKGDLLLVP